eukprot:CAMPEP_0201592988 /NCGR_PEP_ID=MMETSP0190_2-20130828/190725_1 /ASSEMBLY_ACC=CAM_ASM_000263 /TAXON_ID=37353 /ORGANISM="Rosalina sp." /LENGTH=505 /DNA_ID=CAMNT_0048051995 /DNA_START=95 /DNA_END=1612 /DNA_ORIENTATION=+
MKSLSRITTTAPKYIAKYALPMLSTIQPHKFTSLAPPTLDKSIDRPHFERPPMAEPWKIKQVEHLKTTTLEHRKEAIKQAGYNTFLLKSDDVYIDLLTDSGTSAMSDKQWACLMMGDESYAGSRNFFRLWDIITEHYGYKYVVPTHQGRGAEHILSQTTIKPGDYVPGNMYFTTTKLHQELAGGKFVDVIIDEAHDPDNEYRWKGNVDLDKLKELVDKVGANRIPYISVEGCVNLAGGQPMSMKNIKEVYKYCNDNGILVFLDATRAAENAYFIHSYEDGYYDKSVKEILKEFCSYTDGCTMSGKKDALVNIGGWIACNDKELYKKFCEKVVVYEGLHTYGGMAGRDMEAMAQGIIESVDDEHQRSRIYQVHYLGKLLSQYNIPLVKPFGGHAIFLNAKQFLSHIPQNEFPAQTLAAEIYVDSGVRSMERGIVSAGRNKETGDHNYPKLELVRLTIPRRVYTQSHMDLVAYSVNNVYQNRDKITGLKFTYEPENLRFFLGQFDKI